MVFALFTTRAVAVRFWSRTQALESALGDLVGRVRPPGAWPAGSPACPAAAPGVATPGAKPTTGVPPPVPPTATPPVTAVPPVTTPPTPPRVEVTVPPPAQEPRPVVPAAAVAVPIAAATAAPQTASTREALETRIGSRWLLYVGVVA